MSANGASAGNGDKKKVVIIGSGPCGLGAAWRIEEIRRLGNPNVDWTIVESASDSGGLARSVVDQQGFTWDMGGHVIFSHYSYFSRLLDHLLPPSEWNSKVREAWCWMDGTFIPYPLQQNIHRLPEAKVLSILDGLVANERDKHTFTKPATFKHWLLQAFGQGLCDHFMFPYNFKVWAYPADQMNVEWMGERVATVDTSKVIKNVVQKKDELGWGPNNTFRFPLHGGTGIIWQRLYEALPSSKFHFNKRVTRIDVAARTIEYSDGTSEHYDSIVSTMPLDCLCRIVDNASIPRAVLQEKATQFRYSSSHILGFGLSGAAPAHLRTKCWMYFPESDCPFYRVTVFSNYSPYNVPKPNEQWSLMAEVAESSAKPVDAATIIALTEQGLRNTRLITDTDQIVSRWHTRLEYGYPTPFAGRDQLCQPLFDCLDAHGIHSRGRFGSWKYEVSNQDHSLMLGVECADRIVFGTEEMTLKYPAIVNAGKDTTGRVPLPPPQPHKA